MAGTAEGLCQIFSTRCSYLSNLNVIYCDTGAVSSTALLVRVMQLGDLVCVYLCVHPKSLQTQVRKRQNRSRRNLSLEFLTNLDR